MCLYKYMLIIIQTKIFIYGKQKFRTILNIKESTTVKHIANDCVEEIMFLFTITWKQCHGPILFITITYLWVFAATIYSKKFVMFYWLTNRHIVAGDAFMFARMWTHVVILLITYTNKFSTLTGTKLFPLFWTGFEPSSPYVPSHPLTFTHD